MSYILQSQWSTSTYNLMTLIKKRETFKGSPILTLNSTLYLQSQALQKLHISTKINTDLIRQLKVHFACKKN